LSPADREHVNETTEVSRVAGDLGQSVRQCCAPAKAAPCTALMPTPMPYTTTVSADRTPPVLTAVPQPVGTPQPTSAAVSSGGSSSILTHECSDTNPPLGEGAEQAHLAEVRPIGMEPERAIGAPAAL
jgi:hypothetical protein